MPKFQHKSMFLLGKEEIDELKEQISKWEQDKNGIMKNSFELAEMIKILEKRNCDFIDVTSLAL